MKVEKGNKMIHKNVKKFLHEFLVIEYRMRRCRNTDNAGEKLPPDMLLSTEGSTYYVST